MKEGGEAGGRVALVTGSVRGLGLASARRLAAEGGRVHLVWRSSADRARALEEEFPGRIHQADVERPEQVAALVARVVELDGGIDCAVHAVGDYVSGPLEALEPADLRHMLDSNVLSAMTFAAALRPHLRASRGRLVFFGCAGLAGLRGRRETAAYAAAKSALVVLARSLAVEEAPHGVTVNVVSPGLAPHDGAHPDTLDPERLERIPAGRGADPDEVARAVAWLCSEEAGYTTGTDLLVTGGWML